MRPYSQVLLRVGISLVIIWFGLQQFTNAPMWTGYLPEWTGSLPISAITFVHLNAWFEITFGSLLLIGLYTRIVSILIALHLVGITYTVGYNPVGVRDFGLCVALFSIFLYGPSGLSLDKYFSNKEQVS